MSCIICQENKKKKSLVRNPSINSFEKLLERTRELESVHIIRTAQY